MAFEIPKDSYAGSIREIAVGSGGKALKVGGQNVMPLCNFEGTVPNRALVAMEVFDKAAITANWAEEAKAPFADVIGDPVAWAKKNIEKNGADLICLQLASCDPNGLNTSTAEAVETVKKVAGAINVPLIVWGCENSEKDAELLSAVAEACEGMNLVLGPAVEDNYKKIGGAVIAYGHTLVAQTPIDVNMAKQLNILLGNLGVKNDKLIMDPSTGALGYGIEYSYSVIERMRLTGLKQGDDKMQLPVICDVAKYAWKTREANISEKDEPTFGNIAKRGVLWEIITATDLLAAGADILILRHPETVRVIKKVINDVMA
ncbi:acetyl-CoA decarbonylase/synthase complex subunit delta [bacterium]|nr:MAG: acetyl-CoA decarbonylase/synthase complex subunit delta [bacterium]